MNNLKDYREKELKMYIIANIFIMILLNNDFELMKIQENWFYLIVKLTGTTLVSASIYIFVYLADSIFSSELKSKLLYFMGHQPGEKIFSTISHSSKDLRFTTERVKSRYKDIYDNMPNNQKDRYKYENDKWYEIYNKYRDIGMIHFSNRDYLLCRDMYISTVALILSYTILSVFTKNIELEWNAILYLIIMLLITNISYRVKRKRFVYNVLAHDLHDQNVNVNK